MSDVWKWITDGLKALAATPAWLFLAVFIGGLIVLYAPPIPGLGLDVVRAKVGPWVGLITVAGGVLFAARTLAYGMVWLRGRAVPTTTPTLRFSLDPHMASAFWGRAAQMDGSTNTQLMLDFFVHSDAAQPMYLRAARLISPHVRTEDTLPGQLILSDPNGGRIFNSKHPILSGGQAEGRVVILLKGALGRLGLRADRPGSRRQQDHQGHGRLGARSAAGLQSTPPCRPKSPSRLAQRGRSLSRLRRGARTVSLCHNGAHRARHPRGEGGGDSGSQRRKGQLAVPGVADTDRSRTPILRHYAFVPEKVKAGWRPSAGIPLARRGRAGEPDAAAPPWRWRGGHHGDRRSNAEGNTLTAYRRAVAAALEMLRSGLYGRESPMARLLPNDRLRRDRLRTSAL